MLHKIPQFLRTADVTARVWAAQYDEYGHPSIYEDTQHPAVRASVFGASESCSGYDRTQGKARDVQYSQ